MYAVSRHPLDYEVKRAKHIRLDLSDKEAIKQVCTSGCSDLCTCLRYGCLRKMQSCAARATCTAVYASCADNRPGQYVEKPESHLPQDICVHEHQQIREGPCADICVHQLSSI